MKIKGIIDEDFVNFKLPSMVVEFPFCNFKCEKECGIEGICQNHSLIDTPPMDIPAEVIVNRFLNNKISKALVCQGLEPFDSFDDLYEMITTLRIRSSCLEPVVIYTGYTEEEIADKIEMLKPLKHIYVKFGRFKPNDTPHFDNVLGVTLVSSNQYGKLIC